MGGSFADDDYDTSGLPSVDDSTMDVLYDNPGNVDMTEEDRRRLSLPSIKAQHVAGQPTQETYAAAHSNTYPPAGPRPPHTGGLYPPNVDRGSTSSTTSPSVPNSHTPHTSISSMPVSAGSSSMYSQSGMTESPRPLSPGANQANQASHDAALARQRSPVQLHPHFRQPDQAASGLSLPSHGMSPAAKQAWLSHYPPADRTAPQGNTTGITTSPTQQAAARGRGRASSGANASNGISVENVSIFTTEHNMWAYVQQMEARLKQAVDDLEAVKNEVEVLKKDNTHLKEKISLHEHHFGGLTNEVAQLRRPPPQQLQQPQVQPPLEEQHQHHHQEMEAAPQVEDHTQVQTQIPMEISEAQP